MEFLGHINSMSQIDKSPQEIQINVPNMEQEEPVQKISIAKVKWNQDFLKQTQMQSDCENKLQEVCSSSDEDSQLESSAAR